MVKIKRALISVSNKEGIEQFARGLDKFGVEILSTGGTAKRLKGAGIPVIEVSEYTGFPEMLDGRVKTLHPKLHAGFLALRDNPQHMQELKKHQIPLIDMVVVNLYPFQETIAKPNVTQEEAIENIDIGGPTMLRSAAKNYKGIAVICNHQRYSEVLAEMKKNNGQISEETCFNLAREVFQLTGGYNKAIFDYFSKINNPPQSKEALPGGLNLTFEKLQDLRYGENPHQAAAFYKAGLSVFEAITGAKQLHGKELSFNNIIDLDAAWSICNEFKKPAASVIKHTNPCGAACADKLSVAYQDALDCDPVSAFGSIVGLNREVDAETAGRIAEAGFVECIIAPGYAKQPLDILKTKKNLRLIVAGPSKKARELEIKNVTGGILLQEKDVKDIEKTALKVVTKKKPTDAQLDALLFAWKIAKHVKSNSIVLAQGLKTVGIGAGQMSRVDSVIIAVRKSQGRSKGAVLASDAFFPKADGVQTAVKGGITAIIQPGGSIRDEEVIAAADKAGIAMVFTGMRHFKH